jgi:hypothetical protein
MTEQVSTSLNLGLPETWGHSITRSFTLSAGALLALTGFAKVVSALGDSKFLTVVDPILGVQFGSLTLLVGSAEIAIAGYCFFGSRQSLALTLVAWMSTNFLTYRFGLWWVGWKKPCSCLGNLTDALHISPQVAENIMKVVLAYLLIGSYGLLLSSWKRQRMQVGLC